MSPTDYADSKWSYKLRQDAGQTAQSGSLVHLAEAPLSLDSSASMRHTSTKDETPIWLGINLTASIVLAQPSNGCTRLLDDAFEDSLFSRRSKLTLPMIRSLFSYFGAEATSFLVKTFYSAMGPCHPWHRTVEELPYRPANCRIRHNGMWDDL